MGVTEMNKREKQIAEMKAELRLTHTKARKRDLTAMIREAKRFLAAGR
ncbi:hypothetical protein [Rhizobium phage RHph_X2_24]|nr:hypothetical protein [Rhizobium phage RHph_X2_24]